MSAAIAAPLPLSFDPVALSCLAVSSCAFALSLTGLAMSHFPATGMAVVGTFYLAVGVVYYLSKERQAQFADVAGAGFGGTDSATGHVHTAADDLAEVAHDLNEAAHENIARANAFAKSEVALLNPVAKMCFAVTVGAFAAALGGVFVNQWVSGWMNAGGMACVGVFYLVMGVASLGHAPKSLFDHEQDSSSAASYPQPRRYGDDLRPPVRFDSTHERGLETAAQPDELVEV